MQLKSAVGSGVEATEAGSAGPIVQLRLSVIRSPWRISPAWSVIAGAIAGGAAYLDGSVLLRLLASVLLAELAWGSLWRIGAKGAGEGTTQAGSTFLPYSTPGAPVSRLNAALVGRTPDGAVQSGWHDLALGLVLTIALSLLLGRITLVLSVAAVSVSLLAWLLARRGSVAALPLALLGVGLPWLLGAASESHDIADLSGLSPWILAFAAVYTVLQWGVLRAEATRERRLRLLWCGQLLAVVASIGAGLPWLTILLAAVMLVPTLRLAGGRQSGVGTDELVRSSGGWWWAAMMISAFALRLAA
jgi:hypothetical protein